MVARCPERHQSGHPDGERLILTVTTAFQFSYLPSQNHSQICRILHRYAHQCVILSAVDEHILKIRDLRANGLPDTSPELEPNVETRLELT